jgi:hypothetical protein
MAGSFWDMVRLRSGRVPDRNVRVFRGSGGDPFLRGLLPLRAKIMDGRKIGDDRRLLVAQDGQVGQFGMGNRDDDVVLGEDLGSFQSDIYFLVLLLFDRDRLFEAVVMQTHALDRHIVLTSGDSRDIDPVLLVSGVNLINNTGARVIETVEDNQD